MSLSVKNLSVRPTLTGSAGTGDVLTGKTFYNTNPDSIVNGGMANNLAVSANISPGGSYTIPAGYHNGNGKVSASDATAEFVMHTYNQQNSNSWTRTYSIPATVGSKYVIVLYAGSDNGSTVQVKNLGISGATIDDSWESVQKTGSSNNRGRIGGYIVTATSTTISCNFTNTGAAEWGWSTIIAAKIS